jgi:hypothetical protein
VDSLIFTLFKDRAFEVKYPEALIEAYCFQSDFYAKYDKDRPRDDNSFEHVHYIGARIQKSVLDKCKNIINQYSNLRIFDSLDLDSFLKETQKRGYLTAELSKLAHDLDKIPRVGFSKATKILHTRYPEIIPMIDNPLQKEYKELKKSEWKRGDWYQLFKDYYDNFLEGQTYDNLCKVHRNLLFLNLTKIRVFDILWWSFLKSKNRDHKGIEWRTIRQVDLRTESASR